MSFVLVRGDADQQCSIPGDSVAGCRSPLEPPALLRVSQGDLSLSGLEIVAGLEGGDRIVAPRQAAHLVDAFRAGEGPVLGASPVQALDKYGGAGKRNGVAQSDAPLDGAAGEEAEHVRPVVGVGGGDVVRFGPEVDPVAKTRDRGAIAIFVGKRVRPDLGDDLGGALVQIAADDLLFPSALLGTGLLLLLRKTRQRPSSLKTEDPLTKGPQGR